MFSALGSIFTVKPRQAEHTDTRQAIQRHDPDQQRHPKGHKDASDENPQDEAVTVSVEALRLFLEKFLRESGPESGPENTQGDAQAENSEETPFEERSGPAPYETPGAARAAQAASAYQTMAHAADKSRVLLETTDQNTGPPLDLSAADIRTIHALIEDLKILTDADIEYLNIERARTFLESLVNAVENVKARLPAQTS